MDGEGTIELRTAGGKNKSGNKFILHCFQA